MINFTDEEIDFLVDNGFLMSKMDKYDNNLYFYPAKPVRVKNDRISFIGSSLPLGFPVLVSSDKITKKNPNIKLEWFNEYSFTLNDKPINLYMVPHGLELIKNFSDNTEIINKLNNWVNLSEKYILESIQDDEISQIEIDLLTNFRKIYATCLKLENKDISPISPMFFLNYENGEIYRENLLNNFKKIYENLASDKECYEFIVKKFESEKDIILLEENIIKNHSKNSWGRSKLCGIDLTFVDLWHNIVALKFKKSSYKEVSPFLVKFRSELYDYHEKSRSAADVKKIFKFMNLYDFSIVKEDYLRFFNKSTKKEIIQFVEKKLKENNALPKASAQLLINEDVKTVYTNTLTINFNLIKEKIANHILGAETLLAIVTKAFNEEEKECTFISYEILAKDGIVNFLIESLNINTTKELSAKLIIYLNSVISSGFLTVDMIKQLIKHGNGLERKRYEYDEKVMKAYIRINSTALLNKELDKELKINIEKKKVSKL